MILLVVFNDLSWRLKCFSNHSKKGTHFFIEKLVVLKLSSSKFTFMINLDCLRNAISIKKLFKEAYKNINVA